MATFNPRSASPATECPPPPPARSRISVGSGETGNTHARLILSGAEENLQARAQTLDQGYRKVPPTEGTGRIRGHHSSLRSPTRKKPPTMSVIAEPTTKIKVADVVENCRYSGWVRKQGGSYKSCEFVCSCPVPVGGTFVC